MTLAFCIVDSNMLSDNSNVFYSFGENSSSKIFM